jgi:transposase InsO family protein
VVKQGIKDMLDKGLIRPSKSPWSAPVLLVPKKDGKWRFTVDYRPLNTIVPRDAFPLPRIDDSLNLLGQSEWFTTFDLVSGYWQIPVAEANIEKTAFVCSEGLYEYLRMPMGLSNSPATFQRLMQKILPAHIRASYALVYMDNIIIHSATFEEHMVHLADVLDRLKEANLRVKPQKVSMARTEVHYLGHVVLKEGTKPDPQKIEAILKMPRPTDESSLRSFLGLTGYYQCYVRGYAHFAAPLTLLLRKDEPWRWGKEQEEAYLHLQRAMINYPVLRRPDWKKPFVLQTDASGYGLSAVLSQRGNDGSDYALAFASRTLTQAERKWPTHKQEALAVLWGCESFRPYLYGIKFTVETDNTAVSTLRSNTKPGRLTRWGLRLSDFDFAAVARKGRANANSDVLSRNPVELDSEHPDVMRANENARTETNDIPERDIYLLMQEAEIVTKHPELQIVANSVLELRRDWMEEQARCPQLSQIISYLGELRDAEDSSTVTALSNVKKWSQDCFFAPDGLLMKRITRHRPSLPNQLLKVMMVPLSQRDVTLANYHKGAGAAHLGRTKMYSRLSQRCYWPKMSKDVRHFVRTCLTCRSRKDSQPLNQGLYHSFAHRAKRPMHTLSIDLFGELPKTKAGNRHLIVIVDHFSKWPHVIPIPNKSAEVVAQAILRGFIADNGFPTKIVTDRGKEFIDAAVQHLWRLMGVATVLTPSEHPQANSPAERFNRFLSQSLYSIINAEQNDWDLKAWAVLFAYRTSVNPITGETPFFLFHGRDPVLPEDLLINYEQQGENAEVTRSNVAAYVQDTVKRLRDAFRETSIRMATFAEQTEERLNKERHPATFQEGEVVLVTYQEGHKKGESTKFAS